MRRCRAAALAAAVSLAAALIPAAAARAGPAGPPPRLAGAASAAWGPAEQLPGSAKLNAGGHAVISAVSCAAAGQCGAAGYYTDKAGHQQAMVASEAGGSWGGAAQAPASGKLNHGDAQLTSLSCTAGGCTAGGYYTDKAGSQQAMIISQSGGTWGPAAQVPGTAALNKGGYAAVNAVSCVSVGNCLAGGYATASVSDGYGTVQAFVVTETGGTWGRAKLVPGTAALNAGGHAMVETVSCVSAGSCTVGGYYASAVVDGIPTVQAFVASETGGRWGQAEEVPGTPALNGGGYAVLTSVSCAAAGDCGAGGEYTSSKPATQAFVVTETGGTWGKARRVSGIDNLGGLAAVTSVSCAAAGYCGAAGYYQDASFTDQAFVVSEAGGSWGTAQEAPGSAALNQGRYGGAQVLAVSCGSAGSCGAGGYYTDKHNKSQALVLSERGGSWRDAKQVPGTAALNTYNAVTESVSCAAAAACSAGGYYTDGSGYGQAFVVNETSDGS